MTSHSTVLYAAAIAGISFGGLLVGGALSAGFPAFPLLATIAILGLLALPLYAVGRSAEPLEPDDLYESPATSTLSEADLSVPPHTDDTLEVQKLESLGVLAGGIAHDFNNLLMSVLGNSSIALMEVPSEHAAYAPLREIEVAAKRARDLVGQLLAYAGKGNLAPEPVDVNSLVREMGDLLTTAIHKGARIEYEFCEQVPLVIADPTQVRQIVMNLITNASDAMKEQGGGTVHLTTELRYVENFELSATLLGSEVEPGLFVVLTSQDEGCGMTAQTLARIFDPFFTTKATGRGLGLAAVLGIMRRFGGTMFVESTIGTGTTFRMYFPFADSVDEDEDLPTEHTSTAAGWSNRAGGVLLIVDDDPVVLKVTVRMAERLDFQVLTATGGGEAIELFKENHQRLTAVLLDMTMPGMSGLETMRVMNALHDAIPTILTSGYSEAEIPSLQGSCFLQKPYTLKQLTKVLDQVSEA